MPKIRSEIASDPHKGEYQITIKVIVPHASEDTGCNQEQFKRWIMEGLMKLDLTKAMDRFDHDQETDVAIALDQQTIMIYIE